MVSASIFENLEFSFEKPLIKVLFETDFTKEIRIALGAGVEMKEHQTPFPIVVELVKGELTFGVNEKEHLLRDGDILALEGGMPHNLIAIEASVVRLTLSKQDHSSRVKEVAS